MSGGGYRDAREMRGVDSRARAVILKVHSFFGWRYIYR